MAGSTNALVNVTTSATPGCASSACVRLTRSVASPPPSPAPARELAVQPTLEHHLGEAEPRPSRSPCTAGRAGATDRPAPHETERLGVARPAVGLTRRAERLGEGAGDEAPLAGAPALEGQLREHAAVAAAVEDLDQPLKGAWVGRALAENPGGVLAHPRVVGSERGEDPRLRRFVVLRRERM